MNDYYADTGPERVGLVLTDGSTVELRNASENPEQGFLLADDDILRLEDPDVAGTWHTHPGVTGNLSVNDMEAFLAWPNLVHRIVGSDGEWVFTVVDGVVIAARE